jgi:hypothetical protein
LLKGGLKKIKMKFNFKKVASVLASGAMLASTIGFAAAATFPAPFDSGSAIVYGANGNVQVDMAAAVNIQTAIGTISGSSANVPTGSWQVATSSDDLELNESLAEVTTYIDDEDLPILVDGEISNEKGTAKYEQFLYFEGTTGSMVNYQEDDDENIGLFYKVDSSEVIARYVMDFTTNLESDISVNSLEDIDDEEINILGKTYTITKAVNASSPSNVQLTLMSGANKITVANGEELTVAGKTISVLVTSATQAQFTIDGETTNKLNDGDTYKLNDGTYLGVSEITYQNFAGGLMQATVYVGADKIELKNGTSMTVNAETISDTRVDIAASISGGDIAISEITINMTAEDDLFVPEGGKLSEAVDLDEPEVLVTQNWDIVYDGLEDEEYEELSIKKSTDTKMDLSFENYNGDVIKFPLVFVNSSGIYGGEKSTEKLVLNASACTVVDNQGITKNDFFILNTANATVQSNDARSYVVQYKGADKATDTTPKMKFNIVGVDSTKEVTLTTAGTASLKLGGQTFTFKNSSVGTSNDFSICLTSAVGMYSLTGALGNNGTLSNFLRTKSNALINITHFNGSVGGTGVASDWEVVVTIDDTDRDGDKYTAGASKILFRETFSNDSENEVGTAFAGGDYSSWISDPDDSTHSTYTDVYGNMIDFNNPSSAPSNVVIKIPKSIVKPKVFITSGAVTGGTTAVGGLAPIVADSAISTVSANNLVVVGGSCINSVAAKLLGSDSPLCGAEFAAKTNVGAGKYIIDTFDSPYAAGKVAMLVAGYEAADTTAAAQKVVDDSLSPTAAAAAIIGPVTA